MILPNKSFVKFCKDERIIHRVLQADFWRAVVIDGVKYYRTFQDNVIYHSFN